MTGDYYRYLAEFVTDKAYEAKAADYYKQAQEISQKVLEPTHPIRLGLALNYSVCFYEILKDKKAACELAKSAFDQAISGLDKLPEASYKVRDRARNHCGRTTHTEDGGRAKELHLCWSLTLRGAPVLSFSLRTRR
jgi:hypothetical protein